MLLKKDPDKLPCTTWDELTFSGYLWQFIFDLELIFQTDDPHDPGFNFRI